MRSVALLVGLFLIVPSGAARGAMMLQPLGALPGHNYSRPFGGVSGDGATVAGFSRVTGGANAAWRWSAATGILPVASGAEVSHAINGDGSVIVGSTGGGGGFRWTAAGGLTSISGTIADVSADGAIVLGSDGLGPFRWLTGTGKQYLPFGGNPLGISRNGTFIVAKGTVNGSEGFIWSQAGGTVLLGDLPGGSFNSSPRVISDDGSLVVGSATPGGLSGSSTPAYWTAATGWSRWTPSSSSARPMTSRQTESSPWGPGRKAAGPLSGNGASVLSRSATC
jgi:hypothetical protein